MPGAARLLTTAGRAQARCSGNRRWCHLAEWSTNIEGLWWLRRSVCAPEELVGFMGEELAREALAGFDATDWVREMVGSVPDDPKLALGQIESMTYLRNQLLRDSDWASMDHSVELRTPLVDAHLLISLQTALPSLSRHPGKRLLAGAPGNPLPRAIIDRPKTGFGIPIGSWLTTESQANRKTLVSRAWANRLVDAYNKEMIDTAKPLDVGL